MIRHTIHTLLLITLLAITSCNSKDKFVIDCEIRGLDTGRVDMIYFNGHLNTVTAHAADSRVTMTGHTEVPALVDVWDSDGQLLFSLIAVDGDKLKVSMDLDNPLAATIEGNEASELLNRFRNDNAETIASGESDRINAAVEQFIIANPSSAASAAALMTLYDLNADPVKADSLLNRLDATARNLTSIRDFSRTLAVASASTAYDVVRPITFNITTDTTVEFIPYRHKCSLLAVTASRNDARTAKLLKALRRDYTSKKLNMIETSAIADSARWRAAIAGDSATWSQAWLPGGLGNPTLSHLAIPTTPYYIAVDSAGTQLYRGISIEEADSIIRSHLD
ncbi:MAG: hypothetical protein HDR83_03795 [Bacteroides sp.]|nr:hypothetical protein [Bacteroides sp.]MBD5368371.1 hypothetical protein [Bacteroides sp.]